LFRKSEARNQKPEIWNQKPEGFDPDLGRATCAFKKNAH